MFSIDSTAFRKWLSAAGSKLRAETTNALRRTGTAAATYAKLSKLYKSHTYGLRDSIRERLMSPDHEQVAAGAKYASYVEDGTRAHEIKPRRAKALRFEQNGAIHFAKRVYHPGTKPRPFMQEARDKAEPLFDRLCREAVDKAFS